MDGYRPLFPLGAALGIVGAALWPLSWLGLVPWPGPLHASLMAQGFELAFILGFLLTILPRITRTLELRRPWDLPVATGAMAVFGAAALAGWNAMAQAAALVALLTAVAAFVARHRARTNTPPEEFGFVALGLAFGLAGSTLGLLSALGVAAEPVPRFAIRLLAFGCVLSIVLGIGALLVPTFLGIRDPLFIAKIAKPHERGGRRALYVAIGVALVGSFALEAAGARGPGAALRAAAGAAMLLWVWKLWRRPRAFTTASVAMWGAGWFVLLGLVATAVADLAWPGRGVPFEHLVLLGGYGFLTASMAARVVVTHGGHSPEAERRVLDGVVLTLLLAALVARVVAGNAGPAEPAWLAASGACWVLAWGWWLMRSFTVPRRPRPGA